MKQSQKTLAIRGILFNWLGRGSSVVIIFFMTPFLVHTLGDERYGIWSIVMAWTSYYMLADLGLRGAGTKYLAQHLGSGDDEAVNRFFVTSLYSYVVISLGILVVAAAAAWLCPKILHVDAISSREVSWVLFLVGVSVAVRFVAQVFNAALVAMLRHDISNAASVASEVLQAIAVVAVLKSGWGLVGMSSAVLGVAIVSQFVRCLIALKLLPAMHFSLRYFDRDSLNKIMSFGGVTTATRTARQFVKQIAPLIIGVFMGPAAVTFFVIPQNICRKITMLGRSISSVTLPYSSHLEASGSKAALQEMTLLLPRAATGVVLALAGMFLLLGDSLIELWIGPEYVEISYPILCVLMFAVVAEMSAKPLLSILRGTAKLAFLMRSALVEVSVTIIVGPLLFWLLMPYGRLPGLLGLAAGLGLAQIICGLGLVPYYACKIVDIRYREYVRQVYLPAFVAALPGIAAAVAIRLWLRPTHLAVLALEMLLILAVTGLAVFMVCFNRQRRTDVLQALLPRRFTKPSPESEAA